MDMGPIRHEAYADRTKNAIYRQMALDVLVAEFAVWPHESTFNPDHPVGTARIWSAACRMCLR
jgi:hypothetical protein